MKKRKDYSELTFIDDFMFCKVLTSRPELCKELLELILEMKIKKISFPVSQNTIEQTLRKAGSVPVDLEQSLLLLIISIAERPVFAAKPLK